MSWTNATRRLTLRLASGSRMRAPVSRRIAVRLAGTATSREIAFRGAPVGVRL